MEQYTQFQALEVLLQLDMIMFVDLLVHVLPTLADAGAIHAVMAGKQDTAQLQGIYIYMAR